MTSSYAKAGQAPITTRAGRAAWRLAPPAPRRFRPSGWPVDGFGILGLVRLQEQVERFAGMRAGIGHPDRMNLLLGSGLRTLGQLVEHVWTQQRCWRVVG